MERTLLKDLHDHIDEEITIAGWVDVRRDHGKLIFIDLRDRSGKVQMVALPNHEDAHALADTVRAEWVIEVKGKVNKRPERMVNADEANGDIEIEMLEVKVLSKAAEIPFDKDEDINIDTRLDTRPYSLRSQRDRDIFAMQATIIQAYRWSLIQQDFTEFQSPVLVGSDAEGGSDVFRVSYYEHNANLATSPQLYKQIMTGVFERVMVMAKVFRAERSATTRHLSESTQMDFEMGFVKDEFDVIDVLEKVVRDVVEAVSEKHADVFKRFGVEQPQLGDKFVRLTLKECQDILKLDDIDDLDPEGERNICAWAKENHGTDFVFVTKFPVEARAFYTMADSEDPKLSRGFDLLFRGLEINSGAQRIHDYDEMVQRIKDRGQDPEQFSYYLQGFKYGMPPHGGCSTGLDRFTTKMLDMQNIREGSLFPRDMNRIDTLLSE